MITIKKGSSDNENSIEEDSFSRLFIFPITGKKWSFVIYWKHPKIDFAKNPFYIKANKIAQAALYLPAMTAFQSFLKEKRQNLIGKWSTLPDKLSKRFQLIKALQSDNQRA